MVAGGFAEVVPVDTSSGILLSPAGVEPISPADFGAAMDGGVHLIDAPWEKLDEQAAVFRKRGILVRRLPYGPRVCNAYYRRFNPRYCFSPTRFSTAEAAAYALGFMGRFEHGRQLAAALSFEADYLANSNMFYV
jgi:ribosome biogenesis protein Tsr3